MSHFHRRKTDPAHHVRRFDDSDGVQRPEGLTDAEVAWYSAQRQADIRYALRQYTKRAAVGYIVLFAAFLGNVLYISHVSNEGREQVVKSGDIVAVAGCNRDFEDRMAVRSVLIESKGFTRAAYRRGSFDRAELQLRLDFYNERLRALPLPDCRTADEVLTDDPDKPLTVPEPLYPTATDAIVPPVSSEGKKGP